MATLAHVLEATRAERVLLALIIGAGCCFLLRAFGLCIVFDAWFLFEAAVAALAHVLEATRAERVLLALADTRRGACRRRVRACRTLAEIWRRVARLFDEGRGRVLRLEAAVAALAHVLEATRAERVFLALIGAFR